MQLSDCPVGYPGIINLSAIDNGAPGFTEDAPPREVKVGFAHNTVLGVADQVIDANPGSALRYSNRQDD
ncbi:hypothetical protein [Tychonema sp. BBK16]|uniref:hypothetical protein n=1 Tax=Tychonema sp. BBK16 TaxID=2699888 RepID=UPI001F216A04|nr:hypothetical protein [Tychonema sp. BBK16]MCF6373471.1 hypothetical protein [Tychonema sp. BBK16]